MFEVSHNVTTMEHGQYIDVGCCVNWNKTGEAVVLLLVLLLLLLLIQGVAALLGKGLNRLKRKYEARKHDD